MICSLLDKQILFFICLPNREHIKLPSLPFLVILKEYPQGKAALIFSIVLNFLCFLVFKGEKLSFNTILKEEGHPRRLGTANVLIREFTLDN